MSHKLKSNIILNMFIIALLMPALGRKMHIFPDATPTENRQLAVRPRYHELKSIPEITKAFEAYWGDNFGGRSWFINLYFKLFSKYLGDSPLPYVLIGKNGWLFYRSELKNDGPGLNDYLGQAQMSHAELDRIANNLARVNHQLIASGIKLIVVIAPNKHTIYPEYLPDPFTSYSPTTRFDQLPNSVSSQVTIIDMRHTLSDAKQKFPTYYQTDSHWNDYGALLTSLTVENYLDPDLTDDYQISAKLGSGEGDLASMISSRGIFPETYVHIELTNEPTLTQSNFTLKGETYLGQIWHNTQSYLPKALLYGDSFRYSLAPYMARSFSTMHVVAYTPKYDQSDRLIDIIKPDYLIWEVAERYLDRLAQPIY